MKKKIEEKLILKDDYILLALDPSLKCTGWSILKVKKQNGNLGENDIELIDYGIIPTGHSKVGDSLIYFEKILSEIIIKYKPDYATSEQMFAGNNRNTGMKLAYIHGVMQLVLAKNNISLVYFSVMTAKSIVSGGMKIKHLDGTRKTGEEMKKEIANIIYNIFGMDKFKKEYTLDVTDSISIGITFIKLKGEPPKKNKKNKKNK